MAWIAIRTNNFWHRIANYCVHLFQIDNSVLYNLLKNWFSHWTVIIGDNCFGTAFGFVWLICCILCFSPWNDICHFRLLSPCMYPHQSLQSFIFSGCECNFFFKLTALIQNVFCARNKNDVIYRHLFYNFRFIHFLIRRIRVIFQIDSNSRNVEITSRSALTKSRRAAELAWVRTSERNGNIRK